MKHNVVVLGSGSWGTALSNLLSDNGHKVTLWSFFPKESEQLAQTRENPFLPGIKLRDNISFTSDISAVSDATLVLMVTPSFAVRDTAALMAPYLPKDAIIVSATKGIESGTSLRMTQIIEQATGRTVCALSGPSHAEEVGRGIPTGCVAACRDAEIAAAVQNTFMSERFRVYTSGDAAGVEIGAALKNVIALCAGISDGMGLGDNTKALLMTRGLTEIARLGVALGGSRDTFAGLAGLGDLIVTCTSMHSRNRCAGILIGQGKTAKEAMKEVGAVVEGYYAAQSAYELSKKMGAEMPITEKAYEILYLDADPKSAVNALMCRDRCSEENFGAWEGKKKPET